MRASNSWYGKLSSSLGEVVRYCYREAKVCSSSVSVVYAVQLRIFLKAALLKRGSMEPIEPPLDPPLQIPAVNNWEFEDEGGAQIRSISWAWLSSAHAQMMSATAGSKDEGTDKLEGAWACIRGICCAKQNFAHVNINHACFNVLYSLPLVHIIHSNIYRLVWLQLGNRNRQWPLIQAYCMPSGSLLSYYFCVDQLAKVRRPRCLEMAQNK